jgi:hypothetical protein
MRLRIRSLIVLGVLLLAALADLWLVKRPVPHGVAEFNPFVTHLGREELVLGGIKTDDGVLLDYQGRNVLIEIVADKGSLAPQTARMLTAQKPPAPNESNVIRYTGPGDAPKSNNGPPPCTSSLRITLESPTSGEMHIFQSDTPGESRHREVELRAIGSRLIADFNVVMDDPSHLPPAGCHRDLIIGDAWSHPLTGRPVRIVAAAESTLHLKFMPASSTRLWKDNDGLFDPFNTAHLQARSILIAPPGSRELTSFVQAAKGAALLDVTNLAIGSDSISAVLAGEGWVTLNGHPVGPLFSEWIAASYLRATLLLSLDIALLALGVVWIFKGKVGQIGETRGWRGRKEGLHIFLCHCSEDKPFVRLLRDRLFAAGFSPWLDEDDIPVGAKWAKEIRQALDESHAVVICLSNEFVVKTGYVQKELHEAVDLAQYRPSIHTYLFPIRLEDCPIPPELEEVQYVNLYGDGGFDRLQARLIERAQQLNIPLILDTASNRQTHAANQA